MMCLSWQQSRDEREIANGESASGLQLRCRTGGRSSVTSNYTCEKGAPYAYNLHMYGNTGSGEGGEIGSIVIIACQIRNAFLPQVMWKVVPIPNPTWSSGQRLS